MATNGISTFSATGGEPTENEINVTVEFSSNFMETEAYQTFLEERDTLDDIEEVHEWRARLNAYSKEFHQNLVNKSLAALSDFEYYEYDFIDYSPFVVLKIDIADVSESSLVNLAECDNVEHISLAYETAPQSSATWDTVLEGVNVSDIVTQSTYTGDGIAIGVYESGGICDVTNANLVGKNITINPESSSMDVTGHATEVTSILALIAPEARFYISHVDRLGIGWFIDNLCDVVNCSFGYYCNKDNGDGTYTYQNKEYRYDIDGIYDYQIEAHLITVVFAAGNYNNSNLVSKDTSTNSDFNPYSEIVSPDMHIMQSPLEVCRLLITNGSIMFLLAM